MRTRNLFARKIVGAFMGALAVSAVFTLVGYSDEGATAMDCLKELTLALASYLPAALLIHWLTRRDNVWLDIVGVSLTGSAIGFLLKLLFLEGKNGIPAYIARSASEHSWKALGDLGFHALSFIILTTLISLPVIAIAMWSCRWWAKRRALNTAGL